MAIIILKSGDLKRGFSRTKKAAASAPVVITEYGKPAYVLLSFAAYRELVGDQNSLIDSVGLSADTAGTEFLRSNADLRASSNSS